MNAAQGPLAAAAKASFQADQYAPSSINPRTSWWKTWTKYAASWNMAPIPLTTKLVECMGTSFKAGDYKSAHNYFSRAVQQHERTLGTAVTADVKRAIKDALRSITRGQGGSARKEAFPMEDLVKVPRNFVLTEAASTAATSPAHMTILGCWFMTREIELSSALARHIILDRTALNVTWYLPSQKNDVKAVGCARTHGCCCTRTPSALCPFHTALEHVSKMEEIFGINFASSTSDAPLFPDIRGRHLSKDVVVQTLRATAALTGARTTTPNPDGSVRQRFCGHVLRVSGAQAMARANVQLNIIQLIGRWGSKAVERYVQDAPLAVQHLLAQQVSRTLIPLPALMPRMPDGPPPALEDEDNPSENDDLELELPIEDLEHHADIPAIEDIAVAAPDNITALRDSMHMVINEKSGIAHWDIRRTDSDSTTWRARCGWWYGDCEHFFDTDIGPYMACTRPACMQLFNMLAPAQPTNRARLEQ